MRSAIKLVVTLKGQCPGRAKNQNKTPPKTPNSRKISRDCMDLNFK